MKTAIQAPAITKRYSTCCGLGCAGLRFDGWLLRCPNCGSTLITFHREAR